MLTSDEPVDVILTHSLLSTSWNLVTAVISTNVNLCLKSFRQGCNVAELDHGEKICYVVSSQQ